MRKVLMALAVVFAFSAAKAQESTEDQEDEKFEKFHYGVKAGANLGTFTLDEIYKGASEWRWGFTAGFLVERHFSTAFSLQAELLYAYQQAGVMGTQAQAGVRYQDRTEMNFFHLPVLAKFYVYDGFNLYLGPQLGIKLDARQKLEQKNGTNVTKSSQNVSKDFRDLTFDFVGGGGYLFDFGLFLDLRYQYGFLNMLRQSKRATNDQALHTTSFALSVGYMF